MVAVYLKDNLGCLRWPVALTVDRQDHPDFGRTLKLDNMLRGCPDGVENTQCEVLVAKLEAERHVD